MTTVEIKSKGVKWASENGCEMYVVVKVGEYQWWMLSEKTGRHMISNKGKYGRAFADDRVLSHWSGFLANQNN
jgi:chlorite dismutase